MRCPRENAELAAQRGARGSHVRIKEMEAHVASVHKDQQRLLQRAEALEAKLSQAEAEAQAKEEQLTQQLQVGAQRSEELEAKLARLELAHSTREQQRQADNSAATNKALDPGAMLAKLEAAQEESPPPLSPEGGVKKESPLPPSAEGPASEDLQVNEAAYTQPATDSPMTMQQAWTTALLRRDLRVWMRLCLLVRLAARPQAGAGGGTRDGATGGLLLQPRAARQLMTWPQVPLPPLLQPLQPLLPLLQPLLPLLQPL
ncbi:hypothetical protein WJX82_003642 [Trebouxia sp. C0006]